MRGGDDSVYCRHGNVLCVQRRSVSPLPFSPKEKKGKPQTVTPILPNSQGPKTSRALSEKRKRPKSKKTPSETKVTPSQPSERMEQSHLVFSGTVPGPQDPVGNIQPMGTGLPSTVSDEGVAKTTPCLEGPRGDKDSEGNKPPADMEPQHTPVADLSWIGVDYQLPLKTVAEIQALLLSKDELDQESDEEVLEAVAKLDEDPDDSNSASSDDILERYDNTLPLTERQLIKYLRKVCDVLFCRITDDHWEKHEEAAVHYVNLKAEVERYFNKNISHRDDKLVDFFMNTIDKSTQAISDLYKGIQAITDLLKEIKEAAKDDHITAVKSLQESATNQDKNLREWAQSSEKLAWSMRSRLSEVERSQANLQVSMLSLMQNTHDMKSMMTEMYQAFKGQPPSAPSSSQTTTLALTDIPANVEGENIETVTEEPTTEVPVTEEPVVNQPIPEEGPSHTEGETANITFEGSSNHNPLTQLNNPDSNHKFKEEKEKKLQQEEAEKIGLDPKKVITQKSREVFKKAQADELKDLNLQRNEK
ncbi:hypothetical protein Tco_1023212, partial [Tanacetum coccineum]